MDILDVFGHTDTNASVCHISLMHFNESLNERGPERA